MTPAGWPRPSWPMPGGPTPASCRTAPGGRARTTAAPRQTRPSAAPPPPPPPPGVRPAAFGEQDLPALRDQVSRRAVQEGIGPSRAQDLVIAVHEAAANTVVHAGGAGILRIWRDGLSLVCEITDDGRISDPLA